MKNVISSLVLIALLAVGIIAALYVAEVMTAAEAKDYSIKLAELLAIGLIVGGGIAMLTKKNN